MTKKRFTMKGSTILENNEEITAWDCCDLLNELHEENEQLKRVLQNTSDQRDEFHRGARENANRVGGLEKENKQLKEENKRLHTKIFEMRTNIALERTEVGTETYTTKKCAKKFLDDLEKW